MPDNVLVDKQYLQNIANSIRIKRQTEDKYKPGEMSDEILLIETSSGGIKSFENKQQMDADENAELGDKALIYNEIIQPVVVETSVFQIVVFPETVVLEQAFSDECNISLMAVEQGQWFDGWGSLNSNYFNLDCYGQDSNLRVYYESQDGITYIRTRIEGPSVSGDTADLGTLVKFRIDEWYQFNPIIGNFMKSLRIEESALYECKEVRDENFIQYATDIVVTEITETDPYSPEPYEYTRLDIECNRVTYKAEEVLKLIKQECVPDYDTTSGGILLRISDDTYKYIYKDWSSNVLIDTSKIYLDLSSETEMKIADIDLTEWTVNKTTTTAGAVNSYLETLTLNEVVIAAIRFYYYSSEDIRLQTGEIYTEDWMRLY